MEHDRSTEQDMAQAWRTWAARPPRRTPAQAAQRFAAAAREEQERRHAWWHRSWAVAATAAVVLLVAGSVWLFLPAVVPVAIEPVTARQAGLSMASNDRTTLGPGEVLIWLDQETPLYMTFLVPDGNGEAVPAGGAP